MHEISQEWGITLLVSLHDVEAALDRFERVVGLRSGRIAFDGPPYRISTEQIEELYALEIKQTSA
jgi:phosphonate transport system ATP-binding protein